MFTVGADGAVEQIGCEDGDGVTERDKGDSAAGIHEGEGGSAAGLARGAADTEVGMGGSAPRLHLQGGSAPRMDEASPTILRRYVSLLFGTFSF